MDDKQRSKLNMFVLIKNYLAEWTSFTSKYTAFAALYAAFETVISDIFEISGKQDEDNKGLTKSKSQLRAELIKLILEISEKCRGYATVAEDYPFLSLTNFKKGNVTNLADADLVKTAETLHTNVTPKLPLILEYDLVQGDLDSLLETSSAFKDVYTKPAELRKDSANLTETLVQRFDEGDGYLDKIDAIIHSGRSKEPAFVEEYDRMRIMVKSPSRTRALQFWVVNDSTGEPIGKAKVRIKTKAGSDLQKNVKSTGPKGGITQTIMEAGEYDYVVTFGGFITATGSFFINDGLMTEVIVRMKISEE